MSFWSKVGDLAKAGLEKSKEVIAEELRLLKDEYENYDDGQLKSIWKNGTGIKKVAAAYVLMERGYKTNESDLMPLAEEDTAGDVNGNNELILTKKQDNIYNEQQINNKKYLAKIKSSLDEISILYSRVIYSHIFDSGFNSISPMRKELEPFWKSQNYTNEQVAYYINYVNKMDFSNGVGNIKNAIEETGIYITDCYQNLLDDVFRGLNSKYNGMKPAFVIPVDKKIEQQTKIKFFIMPLFNETFQSFDVASKVQISLRQNKRQYDSSLSNDMDLGNMAKHFGNGVMVGVNPLIGVPMFLKGMFGDVEATKNKQQFIDNYLEAVDQCVKALDGATPMLHRASVKAADYCLGRSQELHGNAIYFVCSKLDEQGADLKATCRAVVDHLTKLNKEWGGSKLDYHF